MRVIEPELIACYIVGRDIVKQIDLDFYFGIGLVAVSVVVLVVLDAPPALEPVAADVSPGHCGLFLL